MSNEPRDALEVRCREILEAQGPALWRLAGSYAEDASEREDLYQEICLAIWEALPRFRGQCSERTYVFRIAHNRALSRRWRRPTRATDLGAAEEVVDPRPGPHEAMRDAQARVHLQSAIRGLSLAEKQVITLSLEGLSHGEIAEILGIAENAVAVRLHRARIALRSRLAKEEETS